MVSAVLTDRQAEILAFISQQIRHIGYPPTFREIATRFGMASINGVTCHLHALERKGYIRRDPLESRAIRVPGINGAVATLKCLGTIDGEGRVHLR